MKIEFSKEKTAELLGKVAKETAEVSKKVAKGTKENVSALVEKAKKNSYLRKMKKYSPLFPEQYKSEQFNLPNMIVIVDDAVRRDIDVCEGAIGWLNAESGVETLYLYDEAVEFSGLQFVPVAMCDAVYYVDNFDRNKFIRIDCIFNKAHEERMAELKHIAYSLGAKRCTIEIFESLEDSQKVKKSISVGESYTGGESNEGVEQSFSSHGSSSRSGRIEVVFEGKEDPERPSLKWFYHDDTINNLINMCCEGKRMVKSETLELAGSSSATMSQKTAYAIDSAVGKMGGMSGSSTMDSQVAKENHSKLIYKIEF